MPPLEVAPTTSRVSDVAEEGRVMNEPLDSASTLGGPVKSSSYLDTGIQTLPPPNGDIYKLVYGCDPPAIPLAIRRPVMGIAATGRFTKGPQSNPYESLHGAAYAAPTSAHKTYMDSEFQTGSTDATGMALMKAKTKASIMANKYRKVASKEGYVVCSATDNDMIVHSEQYDTTVQLDMEGNLLEGSTKGRSLRNILGTKSFVQTSTQSKVTAPVQPALFRVPPLKIAALAPSSRNDSPLVFHNEYGSGKTYDDRFVVYDATSSDGQRAPSTTTASTSSRTKRKWEDTRNHEQRAMGAEAAAAAAARAAIAKAAILKPAISKTAISTTAATAATAAGAAAERLSNVPALETATASKPSRTKRGLKDIVDTDKKFKKAKESIDTRRDSEAVEAVKTSTSLAATGGTSRLHVGPALAHDKSSARLSSRDSPITKQSISKPLYKPPGRRQEQGRNESSNDDHGIGNAKLKGSSALSTSGKHSSSAAVGNSERRTSRRQVEDAPRTSRGQRPTVAPYVPPALRANARKAGSNEKKPKNSPN
jgi:hypothetical protein